METGPSPCAYNWWECIGLSCSAAHMGNVRAIQSQANDLLFDAGIRNLLGMREIYLDSNATTRPLDTVVSAVTAAMRDTWGNPSSAHGCGAAARQVLERARDATAALLSGTEPEDIVLTSGGTEGSNAILAAAGSDATIITTAVEHPATTIPAERAHSRGAELVVVPVDSTGCVDPDAFRRALLAVSTRNLYVSIQWANSETGAIQPVQEVIRAVRSIRNDAFIHVDAAQAIGRLPTPADGITALTFSGHKLHGPQGTGAVAFGEDANGRSPALLVGGGQEGSRRSGTQNVAGAAGLAVALEERASALEAAIQKMRRLRDMFEACVLERFPAAVVNARGTPRTPNTSNIRFPGFDGMSLIARLDAKGIRCSQGSACSSGRPEPSRVLREMGLSEDEAYSSVRFSFSILNTEADAQDAARALAEIVAR